MKKVIKLFTLFFFALFFSLNSSYALEYVTNQTPLIDESLDTSLTIDFKTSDNIAIQGATFEVYKVASITADGKFVIDDIYSEYDIDFNNLTEEDWYELPIGISDFIEEKGIEANFSGTTSRDGLLEFDNCEKGLYFVKGKSYVQGIYQYTPANFFISLPNLVQNNWVYEVKSEPKYSREDYDNLINIKVVKVWDDKGYLNDRPKEIVVSLIKGDFEYDQVILNQENNWTYEWINLDGAFEYDVKELDVSDKYIVNIKKDNNVFTIINSHKRTDSSSLPNTGQLWYPVPILVGVGFIFIAFGILLDKKKDDR